jgi:hypothetical protein
MNEAQKLRELAAWYRAFAERAGVAWIWEARLMRAQALEAEAERLDRIGTQSVSEQGSHPGQRQ